MKQRPKVVDLMNKISDYDVLQPFEDKLNEISSEQGLGYFTGEVDRDERGVKVILRVAAMIDSAGVDDFKNNDSLKKVAVEYLDHDIVANFVVEDVVPVSGMEIEVVYRPT
jgi:hypothetical protein